MYIINTLGCKKLIDTAYVLFFVAMCPDCVEWESDSVFAAFPLLSAVADLDKTQLATDLAWFQLPIGSSAQQSIHQHSVIPYIGLRQVHLPVVVVVGRLY